jgi:hypothetical protein
VPIFQHDEHDLLPRIRWARRHPQLVQHIIQQANAFALQYTTYRARLLYWKHVLLAYRSLVLDMQEHFDSKPAAAVPAGNPMEALLRSHLTAVQLKQQREQQQQQQHSRRRPRAASGAVLSRRTDE